MMDSDLYAKQLYHSIVSGKKNILERKKTTSLFQEVDNHDKDTEGGNELSSYPYNSQHFSEFMLKYDNLVTT
jgi:hypothetical protein